MMAPFLLYLTIYLCFFTFGIGIGIWDLELAWIGLESEDLGDGANLDGMDLEIGWIGCFERCGR